MARRVGIVGVPPLAVIAALNQEKAVILDLDEYQVNLPFDQSANWLPRVYCAILRSVALNCMALELDAVYIDTGRGKCDAALHLAEILQDVLTIPIMCTCNADSADFGFPLCTADMPMVEKFERITKTVRSVAVYPFIPACEPVCGFWGVPPRDFSLLRLFPDRTHIFGWTRCMENKTPANLALERYVNPNIPTVFFAQSFCAKSALAQHLASRHPRALVVDSDVSVGNSTRAKIEAFLELTALSSIGQNWTY